MGNKIRSEHREAYRLGLLEEIPADVLALLKAEELEKETAEIENVKASKHLAAHPGDAE